MDKNGFNHSKYWFYRIMEGQEDIQGQQVATMDMLDSNAPKFNAKNFILEKKMIIHKYLKRFIFGTK